MPDFDSPTWAVVCAFMAIPMSLFVFETSYMFWKRKHIHPISGRVPELVMLLAFVDFFYPLFTAASILKDVPCGARHVTQAFFHVIFFISLLVRWWNLHFRFGLAHDRVAEFAASSTSYRKARAALQSPTGAPQSPMHVHGLIVAEEAEARPPRLWFLQHAHWGTKSFTTRLAVFLILLLCIPIVVMGALESSDYWTEPDCNEQSAIIILLYVEGLAAGVVGLVLAYRMKDEVENLKIKLEFKFAFSIILLSAASIPMGFTARRVIFLFGFGILHLVVVCMPLYYSYKRQVPRLDVVTPEEVKTFEGLLSTRVGVKSFQEFLISELSVENLFFFLAVQEFKRAFEAHTFKQNVETAERIFNDYIVRGAPSEVNLPNHIRAAVIQELPEAIARTMKARVSSQEAISSATLDRKSHPTDGDQQESAAPTSAAKESQGEGRGARATRSYARPVLLSEVFDLAVQNIFTLMREDSYVRYLNSPEYSSLLARLEQQREVLTEAYFDTKPLDEIVRDVKLSAEEQPGMV